jgi:serine phosphatase RsbU (regulator of sigma subunit)
VRAPDFDDLTLVDANEALRRHFETRNYGRARLLWVAVTLISLGFLIGALDDDRGTASVVVAANLVALATLPLLARGERFRRNFATILLAALAVEILVGVLSPVEPGGSIGYAIAVTAPALLLLRLRPGETAALAALAVGAVYLRLLVAPAGESEEPMSLGAVVGVAIALAIAGVVAQSITQRQRQEFLVQWRLAASRERDRRRMRDELHDARTIQLAMLPAAPPAVPGLDVAGVCVPASEVGGDYYDYFADGDGTLGVAIGDVAGHGMASGLVLAGVRAGLHLLADELASDPARVLARLNGIVGGPGGQRLLMTLGLARFDPRAGRAAWVAAGHPPPLRWDAASGACESPATGHPPLGTRLPIKLETVLRPLAPGDVWLLLSDGAIEARDVRQREFGDSVLARAFARLAASGDSASTIIDGLLAELTRFRGGETQQDDLTLVVVRVPPP